MMSEQLQLRRGTESQIAAFTGAQGEATPATDTMRLHIHDGATAGGWPHGLESRSAVSDANYSAKITDRQIAYTAITAARTVSLPAAASYPTGAVLLVVDESGSCSAANAIALSRAGSDVINGATSAIIANAHGFLALESNGVNAWTIVDQSASNLPPVGIGTPSDPTASLKVSANASALPAPTITGTFIHFGQVDGSNARILHDAFGGSPTFDYRRAQGTAASPSAVTAGLTLGQFNWQGYGATSYSTGRAQILGAAAENWSDTAQGAYLAFWTTAKTTTTIAERMRIADSGYVGIGTMSPGAPLDVAGAIQTHGAYGSTIQPVLVEDTIACSGSSSVSTQQIPNRAVVLAVSVLVVTAITGATAFNVDATTSSSGGAGGSSGQFGSTLGASAGSSNVGVIGPTAWYAASTIKLTAVGGGFTGGQVRIAIQYLLCGAPTS